MKKKIKVIISSTAILSIASIVIGCSLACVQYNKPTQPTKSTKPVDSAMVAKNQTPILASNDVRSFNDNAYLKTINQDGTVNPLGKKWTKTSALKYYTNLLDSNVKIFGITSILKWNLIQNFNYQINELQSTFANNTKFNLNVNHFNYIIFNTNNNDTKLSDYLCNINFNFTATITSKNDSNATFSFSCQYTYKNVKVNAIIHNINNNGYGYFELTNTTANTLVPSSATYFDHATISSAWTNDDFNDLIASGYLPTTGNQTINTNNYTTVLPADCARALALLTNNTQNNLTNNQQIVVSPVNFLELYTFNIGLKFDDLNDLVIMPLVSANTSDGNMYTYSYNAVVSLGVNLALSTIDSKTNNDLKYMWQYSSVTKPNWKNDTSVSALTSTLTFNANENYMYRLIVTKPDGTKLTSNSIIINVVGNNLSIISGVTPSTNNTYTYSFGTQATLSITTKEWLNPNLGLIYTWQKFDNNTGEWQQLASSSKDKTYSVNVLQSDTYRLIITQKNNPAFNLISNTVLLNVVDNTVHITSNATNPLAIIYGNKVTFSITTKIWQKNPDVNYQWYEVKNGETNKIGANTDTYTTSVTSSASYYLVITHNPSIKGFKLTSNSIQVGTTDNSLNIEIKKQPVNNNNIYSFTYWTQVYLIISSSYWSDVNNPDLVYTWCKFDATTNKYKPISNPANNYNYYRFNLTDNGSYELQITTKKDSPDYNPDFLLTSNPVQINVTDKYVNIAASSDNVSLAGNEITPTYGSSVTLQVSAPSIWVNNQSLTYQWYKIVSGQTTGTGISKGSTYTFNVSGKATYYLEITNKDGFSLTSNQISINPQIPSLNIEVEGEKNSQNSTYSFTYGSSVILGVPKDSFWNTTTQPFTWNWQYFDSKNNNWTNVTSNDTSLTNGKLTYSFNCFKSRSYKLVISNFDGKPAISSNIININVLDSTLQIGVVKDQSVIATNNTYSEIYGNSVTLGIVTPSWRNPASNFKVTYQWQKWDSKINNWTNVGTNSNTFTTNPLVETEKYRLEIDSSISGFALPPSASLTINLTNNTLAINPTYIQGQKNVSVATNNTYQITYGSYTTLGISSTDFWDKPSADASAASGLVYQWMKYDVVKGKFMPISQANTNTYSFYASENGQYELVITNPSISSNFNLTSNPVIVNIINQTVNVDLTVPNTTITASANGSYNVTYGASPTLSLSGYWATQTTFNYLVYQWYKLDPITSTWNSITNATSTNTSLELPKIEASGTYKLEITAKPNANAKDEEYVDFKLPSNEVIVNVINSSLQIGIKGKPLSANNFYNVTFGTPLVFNIATKYYQEQGNSGNLAYQWQIFNVSKNGWQSLPPPDGTSNTYSLNAFANGQYQLVITNTKLGFSLTSNTLNLNVNDSTIDIVAAIDKQSAPTTVQASYNVPYATSTILSIISTNYWAQNPTGLTYQWYSINANGQPSEITGATKATYSFNPLLSGSYQLVVKNPNITGFKIPSNIITINVIDSNIAIGINKNEVSTYSTNFGKQVTLSLLSDYWKNTKDVTFQWQYLDNGTWTNVVPSTSGRSYSYTFTASSSVSYQLIVTTYNTTDDKPYPPLTSNSINVMVSDTTLMITSDKNSDVTDNIKSGVVDVNYGGSITFSIDTPYWQEMTTGVAYQWEISTDNGNSYNNISTNANEEEYKTAIFKDVAYRLTLTINDQTLISNQIFVRVINNTVTIATTTGSNDVNYGSSVTLSANSYWVNNASNYNFSWYSTADPTKPLAGSGIGKATYTFTGLTNQIYYVQITSASNETEYKKEFGTLPSNDLSIIIENTTSKINIQDYTDTNTNNSNSYNITYGQSITLQIDPTDYWANAIKDSKDYSFQWEIWNGTTYVPVDINTTPSSTPSTTNGLASTYQFTAITNGQYILAIKNTNISGFGTLLSNAILVNVINSTVQIAYKQNSSNTIASSYNVNCGTLVTLDISDTTSYWSTVSTTDYTFTWQVWDASISNFKTAPKSVDTTSPMIYSTYVLLESNMYRLEISEPNNHSFVPIYSNNITFNPLKSTLTIAPTTVTTPATGNSYNVVYGTTSYSLGINTAYWQTFSGLKHQWYQWNSQKSKFEEITTNGSSPTFNPSTLVSGTYQLEITDSAIGLTLKSNELTINIVDSSYLIAPTSNAVPNVNTYSVSLGDSVTLGISPSSFWNGKSGNTYQWEYLYNGTWYTIEQMENMISNWNPSYSSSNDGKQPTYKFNVNNQTAGTYKLVLTSTGTYEFSDLDSSNNIYVSVINTQLPITANNESVSSTGTYSFNYGTSVTLSIEKGTYYDGLSGWDYQWLCFNGEKFVPVDSSVTDTTTPSPTNGLASTYNFNALVSNAYELKITNKTNKSITLTSSPINIDVLNASVNILASAPYGSSTGSATPWSNNSAYVPYTSPLQLKLDSDYWYNQLTNTELTYTIYDDTTGVASWTSTSGQILTINDILASGTYKLVITNPKITETLPNGDTQHFNVSSNIIAVTVTETSVALQGSCAQNIANATTTPSNGIIDISYWATANINIQLGSYWATQINNSKYSFELWNQTTNQKIDGVSGPTLMNGVATFQISQFTSPMALQLRIYEVGTNNYIPSNILQLKVVNNDFYLKTNALGATYNSETSTWTVPIYCQTSSASIDVAPVSSSSPTIYDAFSWILPTLGPFSNIGVVYYQYDPTSQTWTGIGGGPAGPTPPSGSIDPYQRVFTVPLTSGKDILIRYKAEIVIYSTFPTNQIVKNGFSINVPITIFDNVGKTFNWQLNTNHNVTQVSSTTYQVNPNTPLTFSTAFTENFLSNYESTRALGGTMLLQRDINGTWTTVISDQTLAFASEYQNNGFYPVYNSSENWNIAANTTYAWSIVDTSNWRLVWWYIPRNATPNYAFYYSEPITIIVNKPTLPIQIENANSQIVKSVDNIYFLNPNNTYNLSINMDDSNIDFPGYSGTLNDNTPYVDQGYVYIATYEWEKAIIQPNGTLGSWQTLASFTDPWYNPSGSTDYDKFEELSSQLQSTTTYNLPTIAYNDLTISQTAMYKLTVLMAGTTMISNWSSMTINQNFSQVIGNYSYVVPNIAFTMEVQSTFVVVPSTTASTKNSSSTNNSISLLNYLTVNKNYQ